MPVGDISILISLQIKKKTSFSPAITGHLPNARGCSNSRGTFFCVWLLSGSCAPRLRTVSGCSARSLSSSTPQQSPAWRSSLRRKTRKRKARAPKARSSFLCHQQNSEDNAYCICTANDSSSSASCSSFLSFKIFPRLFMACTYLGFNLKVEKENTPSVMFSCLH